MSVAVKTRADLDFENRDPKKLHEEMKIEFDDLFGEPSEDVHSFKFVFGWAFCCFTFCKAWAYKIFSLFCGICSACKWGCCYGHYAFCMIWMYTPMLKFHGYLVKLWKTQCVAFLECCCGACKDFCIDWIVRSKCLECCAWCAEGCTAAK